MPQFLISDSDLKNIYDCIKGYGEISDALLLLSKPLDEEIPRERVYEDVLILTLTEGQVEELVTSIADESGSASIMVILARSVKKGLAVRGEEDSDDDDDDDDDDEEEEEEEEDDDDDDDWNPGDFGHPLNADGTPREARRIEGYCVSCKTLRVFDGYIRIADSGNSLVNGACPVCYTRMSKTV
jgi:ribosomal protein L12E/L44/L45/RPP1/RPP2